jgi:hypothetical protein
VHGGIGERAVDQDAVPGIRHIGELRYVMAPKQIVKGILPPLARFRRHCPPPPYQVLLRIRVACRTVAPAPGKRNRYGTWTLCLRGGATVLYSRARSTAFTGAFAGGSAVKIRIDWCKP